MRAPLLALITVLTTACGGAGQSGISGRIIDQTGAPVARAEVSTEPATDLALTNERGFFSLRAAIDEQGESQPIPSGKYQILVKKVGFGDLKVDLAYEGDGVELPPQMMRPRSAEFDETAPEATPEKERGPDDTSVPIQGT